MVLSRSEKLICKADYLPNILIITWLMCYVSKFRNGLTADCSPFKKSVRMLVLDRTVILLIWRLQCWQHCQSVRERMSDDHIPIIWYSDSAKKRRRRNAKNMKLYTPCSVVRVQLQCYGRVFWKLLRQPKLSCIFLASFEWFLGWWMSVQIAIFKTIFKLF